MTEKGDTCTKRLRLEQSSQSDAEQTINGVDTKTPASAFATDCDLSQAPFNPVTSFLVDEDACDEGNNSPQYEAIEPDQPTCTDHQVAADQVQSVCSDRQVQADQVQSVCSDRQVQADQVQSVCSDRQVQADQVHSVCIAPQVEVHAPAQADSGTTDFGTLGRAADIRSRTSLITDTIFHHQFRILCSMFRDTDAKRRRAFALIQKLKTTLTPENISLLRTFFNRTRIGSPYVDVQVLENLNRVELNDFMMDSITLADVRNAVKELLVEEYNCGHGETKPNLFETFVDNLLKGNAVDDSIQKAVLLARLRNKTKLTDIIPRLPVLHREFARYYMEQLRMARERK